MQRWCQSRKIRIAVLKLRVSSQLLLEHLRAGPLINIDETPVQVLRESGRENTTKSYMWVARGGSDGQSVLLFRYAPTRAGSVACDIVWPDFRGYLQSDGYSGYKALGGRDGIIHVGCLAHVRRKFAGGHCAGQKTFCGFGAEVARYAG